jgi:3-oxoacyl-(acyl-carrier-protein) synthase
MAIEELFGGDVPVVAAKGVFGEYAAAGGLQVVSGVVALGQQALSASVGFEIPEDGCGLSVVTRASGRALRHVLVNSFSAGGGIVCAVLSGGES